MKTKKRISLLLFLLPATLIYTLFQVYPLLSGFYYGLTDWDGLSPNKVYVGLDNFKEIFHDPLISKALWNTLKFTVLIVILQNGLGLILAIILDRKMRGLTLFRSIYFVPALLSSAVVGFTWSTILNPVIGSWGPFFEALGLHHIAKYDVLGNSATSLYAVVFTMLWQFTGYSMIIYLSGLQTISRDLYESADIDGANRWKKFLNVTFPLIAPALTINLVLSTIGSLKLFDQVFVLTGGGPGDSSQVIGTAIYTVSFANNRYGYGTAMSMMLFLLIALVTLVQLSVLKKREAKAL